MFPSIQPWKLQFKTHSHTHEKPFFSSSFCFRWLFFVQIGNARVHECKQAYKVCGLASLTLVSTFFPVIPMQKKNAVAFIRFFLSSFFLSFFLSRWNCIVSILLVLFPFHSIPGQQWLYARKVTEMWRRFFLFFNNWCLSIKYYYHLPDIPSIFSIYVFLFSSAIFVGRNNEQFNVDRFSFWLDTHSIIAMLFASIFQSFIISLSGRTVYHFQVGKRTCTKNLHTLFRCILSWHCREKEEKEKTNQEYDEHWWSSVALLEI